MDNNTKAWAKTADYGYLFGLAISSIVLAIMIGSIFTEYMLKTLIGVFVFLLVDIIIIARYKLFYFYDENIKVLYYFTKQSINIDYSEIIKVEIGHKISKGPYCIKIFIEQKEFLIPYCDSIFVKRLNAKLEEHKIPLIKINNLKIDGLDV